MSQTLTAIFDGQVLRPDTPLNLEPDKRYVITIEAFSETVTEGNPLQGKVLRYDDPYEPVAADDWDAIA